MKIFKKKTEAASTEETDRSKNHKFRLRITTTTIFIALGIILVIGISGFSFHSYIKTAPSFCATCHNMESHVTSYLSSSHLDNVHYQANVMCKDCHSNYTVIDEATSLVQYVTGDYDDIFTKRKYDNQMCLQCHISQEFQAQQTDYLTRNPHDSHWPDLPCGTCHVSHANQVNYCAQCHENGGQQMIEEINLTSGS